MKKEEELKEENGFIYKGFFEGFSEGFSSGWCQVVRICCTRMTRLKRRAIKSRREGVTKSIYEHIFWKPFRVPIFL